MRLLSMGRFTKWLVNKGVPKTAGAAAERLSARLSVIAVLGTCAAALFPPSVPLHPRYRWRSFAPSGLRSYLGAAPFRGL